jgi:hypothetical protein
MNKAPQKEGLPNRVVWHDKLGALLDPVLKLMFDQKEGPPGLYMFLSNAIFVANVRRNIGCFSWVEPISRSNGSYAPTTTRFGMAKRLAAAIGGPRNVVFRAPIKQEVFAYTPVLRMGQKLLKFDVLSNSMNVLYSLSFSVMLFYALIWVFPSANRRHRLPIIVHH